MKTEDLKRFVELKTRLIPAARTQIDELVAHENTLKHEALSLEKVISDAGGKGQLRVWSALGQHVVVQDRVVTIAQPGALE